MVFNTFYEFLNNNVKSNFNRFIYKNNANYKWKRRNQVESGALM